MACYRDRLTLELQIERVYYLIVMAVSCIWDVYAANPYRVEAISRLSSLPSLYPAYILISHASHLHHIPRYVTLLTETVSLSKL
jgi:hypothetical protein